MASNRQSTFLHERFENTSDLATLNPVSDDVIVSCLRERYTKEIIYTSIGSSAIVALNPHQYVPSNGDQVLTKYAAEYRNTSPDKEYLPPHIFQLANNAYYHMRRTQQDQCILLRCVLQPVHSGCQARQPNLCFPSLFFLPFVPAFACV